MSLKCRVRRLERQINLVCPEEDARAYLQLGIQLGVFKKEVITEATVKLCAAQRLTLSNALKAANGATRGLPSRKHRPTIMRR